MSTATEQNFPTDTPVLVNDPAHELNNTPGIVVGHYGDFGLKIRIKGGRLVNIDSSAVRTIETTTVENVEEDASESTDDTDTAEESKTPISDKWKALAKSAAISLGIPLAVIASIVAVSVFARPEPTPEPVPVVKTEKELAVERINERNVKIAPVSDACVTLEELKRANEADLRILFPDSK